MGYGGEVKHSSVYLRSHLGLLVPSDPERDRREVCRIVAGLRLGRLGPLLLLVIYAAVYLFILQVRAPSLSGAEYVVLIFTGLVPFLMSSEALMNGVPSVVSNKAVLSNTVFPIDLVPIKAVLISQVTMVSGMVIVLLASLALRKISVAILLFPVGMVAPCNVFNLACCGYCRSSTWCFVTSRTLSAS